MKVANQAFNKNITLWLIASLTLGLAPFTPPHIWGKLKWIYGGGAFSGGHPMQAMDWFDLLLHGTPWLMLFISLGIALKTKLKTKS
tara:strand:+ start:41 stop:298 length:258 start_codon:yes stop_codon:yes gene_type:complete